MAFTWQGMTIYKPEERIDKSNINKYCDSIIRCSETLKKASDDIKEIADRLNNENVLYVNQQTYSKNLYEYSDELMKKYKTLHDVICPTIKRWAEECYTNEETEYNMYLESLDQQESATSDTTA